MKDVKERRQAVAIPYGHLERPGRWSDRRAVTACLSSESTDSYQAMVLVCVPGSGLARFDRHLRAEPAVVAAWHVVGDIDVMVQVACPDLADLDRVVSAMPHQGGAAETVTHLVVGGRGR